ncbi:hypothetical protein ACUY4R_003433 [Kosakonia sp. BK9b]
MVRTQIAPVTISNAGSAGYSTDCLYINTIRCEDAKMNQGDLMKKIVIAASLIMLSGCSFTKQAKVSEVDPISGLVRLSFNQQMLQTASYDQSAAQSTANKQCQQMGYATAVSYGRPVETCSLISGSVCMNTKVTIQYQCRGMAFNHGTATW